MFKRPIRRVAALLAGLSLAFAVVVPLHTHTCRWPSAAAGATRFEPLTNGAGSPTEREGACLACTIAQRLQAPVTVEPALLHALPTVARGALTPLPGRTLCGVLRLAPSRGPPLFS